MAKRKMYSIISKGKCTQENVLIELNQDMTFGLTVNYFYQRCKKLRIYVQ